MTLTPTLTDTPVTRPQETCDWLDRGTFERLCASAYDMTVQDMHPPAGESFCQGNVIWASRRDFALTLADVLGLHIFTLAHAAGLPGFEVDAARFDHWHQHVPTATSAWLLKPPMPEQGPIRERASHALSDGRSDTAATENGASDFEVPAATTTPVFSGSPGKTLPPAPNGSKSNQEADAGDHP